MNPPNKQTPKYLHNIQPGYVFNIDRFDFDELNEEEQLIARQMYSWVGFMIENNY